MGINTYLRNNNIALFVGIFLISFYPNDKLYSQDEMQIHDKATITDVFTGGQEGYPVYRIPALTATREGWLLAFCEGRSSLDDHSGNDIVINSSSDHGITWHRIYVFDAGDHALNNPTVMQDNVTGNIILMYQDYPEAHGERGVGPGYKGGNICRTYITFSPDDGITWTMPREITRQVKRKKVVTSTASGPGTGIQLTRGKYAGRILFPFNQGPWRSWKVYAVFSDDNGHHWKMGYTAPEGSEGLGNEVQFAERSDGSVLLNCRSFDGTHHRKTAYSTDGGNTWSPLTDDLFLTEPGCQGSMLRFSFAGESKSRIIYCGPSSQENRTKGMIHISYDDGKTWPLSHLIYAGSFAYSCLTKVDSTTVGVLFERDQYQKISYMEIDIDLLQ